jgi:hypothetical protein
LELKHERPFLSYHYRYVMFSLFLLLDQFVLFFIFPYPQGEKEWTGGLQTLCLSTNSLPNFFRELMSIIIQLFFFVWQKSDLSEGLVLVWSFCDLLLFSWVRWWFGRSF